MKQLLTSIALTIGILLVLNMLYSYTAFHHQIPDLADQYLQVRKIKNCDIIYVSASSNFAPTNTNDSDPRKISQFVADYFPNHTVEAINKPASHAGIHLEILSLFPDDAEAKIFIVTVNLRSFGLDWIHSDLETPLRQSAVFYNHRPALLNRALVSLSAYDNSSAEDRKKTMLKAWEEYLLPFDPPRNTVANWCAQEKWGDWTNPTRQLADQFIKQYGFVVNEDHPRVADFDAIVALANERNWKLLFHILPENTETADSLVGPELVTLMNNNAAWLVNRYQGQGVEVLNNLNAVGAEHFTDKDFPTEHYDEVGRKIIAKSIAETIQQWKIISP